LNDGNGQLHDENGQLHGDQWTLIVGTTQRLTVTKWRESIVNVEVMVMDRCTQLHGDQWTLVQNPRRAWKKENRVIKDGLV
jgi:hypothetical protein